MRYSGLFLPSFIRQHLPPEHFMKVGKVTKKKNTHSCKEVLLLTSRETALKTRKGISQVKQPCLPTHTSLGHALVWCELPPPPTFSRGFAQSSSEPGTSYTARDAKARMSFWCQSLRSMLPGEDIRGRHSLSNTLWLAPLLFLQICMGP